jgi:enoyl-CoA hydratase/carnithine racemase
MPEVLEIRREKRLLRLTLNRPEKRNALNLPLCRALVDALDQADGDSSLGAVLITGSGKAFCAGMDLSEALQADRAELDDLHERLFTAGYRLRKPIIAGVHGPALAGGTGLAANAHILIASAEATFGLTEIRIGLWPILIFRAVKVAVGERRATELALTGRTFGGREAFSYGLVHEVSEEPLARAAEIALQISQASADAIRSGLDYVNQARDKSWEEAGRIGWEIRQKAMSSPDFAAGVRGFLKKGTD